MSLIDTDRFFVRQKAKLIELVAEFAILDENGNKIGAVNEVGQSKAKKVLRFVSNVDQFLSKKFSVLDEGGTPVLALQRGAKFIKSKIEILDGQGATIGMIAQQNAIGKIRFAFLGANGENLGGIFAENWRAWDFRIEDASGQEVGRVTKKWAGAMKEMFTTADNYYVELSPSLTGTARQLAFAAAVTVDTALKQDDR
jgi:uncharacterized protein YxjI